MIGHFAVRLGQEEALRTPRPHAPSRGIGTLIGNGWLRESPRNRAPGWWDLRSKSALRKCIYMPVPRELLEALPPGALGEPAREAPRVVAPSVPDPTPRRREARRDVQMIPAVDPDLVRRVVREQLAKDEPGGWWEGPVALGVLLLVMPPVGLAALWTSRRYSGDARWALTIMTALGMCLASAVAITALALR